MKLDLCTLRVVRTMLCLMVILVLLIITGCGKKGPVRPKLDSMPEAPQQLSIHQQGNTFVLSWDIPEKNQDGSVVLDLAGFRIRRLYFPAEESCPSCRKPQDIVTEIDLIHPEPAQRIGTKIFWRDESIKPDTGYVYSVSALTTGKIEAASAKNHRVVYPVPESPKVIEAVVEGQGVRLSWEAPDLPTDMELVGYNLYRRQTDYGYSMRPINSEPLTTTVLFDRGVETGGTYEYRIETLVLTSNLIVESTGLPVEVIIP